MKYLLAVEDLHTFFFTSDGVVKAVNGVDLKIKKGETLGLVGESGCGKTVLSLSIMRLVPNPPGRIMSGRITFNGRDLLGLDPDEMRDIRGNETSMIFQEPMTSLNPVFTVGEQIAEAIRLHQRVDHKKAVQRSVEILDMVGIPDPSKRIKDYPHQMSGGMRQRVMIAMALSCQPDLLIADEPTSALDVTIQAQILELIDSLKNSLGMSVLMVTHDLGVVAETAQKVSVMYAGYVVEEAGVRDLFHGPLHPYTIALLDSLPRLDDRKIAGGRLKTIKGTVPDLFDMPIGCPFASRCERARQRCITDMPRLVEIGPGHLVSCWEAKP
ncbi:ABC transporter ATP-binding protein [bacterium]|nr:ABC transporter ATP-binding protein [bacterium]